MSTTIDSLQIEIQSNSSNAAAGVRDLAKSLGELKKNGTISVAVKNLNNLSAALRSFSTMPSPASKIGALTSALQALKNVGSVTSIANSMTKLNAAMRAVDSLDTGSMDMKMSNVARALSQLSSVKAGGISSMVNALGRIGKVTESLNDEAIGKFADRVQKLNEKLEPLSAKMTTIQAGLRGINSNARNAGSGVKQLGNDVNATTLNMASMITVVQGLMAALQPVIQMLTEAIGQAIEWDGIAARFGRGFGESAEETYAWIQRLNEEMGINIQQFMQYSSVYATMLTGFGVAMEDAGKMALGYTELTYDIWAGYNDVYKNFADAAEAVKSAIAGEVEPIRRAGFTIVESTLEQTAKNHGLTVSLEKATEAEKSYLRYLTLVDQAHSQGLVGTYAKELNTAEGLVRTLSQQMKSLAQAFGSLFLPILVKVLPYLQAFVEMLIDAVNWVGALFGFKIQEVDWSGYKAGLDNLGGSAGEVEDGLDGATQAAKDLKKATLGIDELNVISPPTKTGGGGGGSGGSGDNGFGGLTVDSLWDESIFNDVQRNVDEIKKKLEEWLPLVATIGAALALWRLSGLIDDLDNVTPLLKGLSTGLKVGAISLIVGKLVWDFTGAYLESGDWLEWLKSLGTTAIGAGLAYKFGGKGGAAFVVTVSGVAMLSRLVFDLSNGEVDWGDPQAWVTLLTGSLEAAIGGYFTWKVVKPVIVKVWPKIAAAVTTALANVAAVSAPAAGAVAIAAALVAWIAFGLVDYDFTDFGKTIGEKLGEAIKKSLETPKLIAAAIIYAIGKAKDYLGADSFGELIVAFFDPSVWMSKIAPAILKLAVTIKKAIVGAVEDFFENFTENEKELVDGFWTGLLGAFGVGKDTALKISPEHIIMTPAQMFDYAIKVGNEFFPGLMEGISSTWDTFWKETEKQWNQFIESVKAFFGIHSPSTKFAEIGTQLIAGLLQPFTLTALLDKIKSMWETAKNWWNNSKGDLSTYTPNIGAIVNKVSGVWSAAKTWWNEKKGSFKTYTPSIGSIYEKAKERWDNARTWWNSKKSNMNTYTPSIGSIYDKVYARWKNARDWWNKKKGSMSYTPSIGSITDKLKSAWNSAKKWWNSNVKLSTKLNVQVPTIKVKWDTATAFGKSFKYPTGFSLKFAANGGIFDAGSLIWAGERGAEVVANAGGGKTGVMNVNQMQEAVYEGVFAAMSAAMRGGAEGGGQSVNVYLDGRQILATVEQRQRERGATIMGKQVYSY